MISFMNIKIVTDFNFFVGKCCQFHEEFSIPGSVSLFGIDKLESNESFRVMEEKT